MRMKYRTFIKLVWFSAICAIILLGYGAVRAFGQSSSEPPRPLTAQSTSHEQPPSVAIPQPQPIATQQLTTDEMRVRLEDWLKAHGNRQNAMRLTDILPNEPFKVTVIRFKEEDAVKFSNDASQWSQFRLDLNRDGIDDEKWLLKNGHTYKRETLDRNGKTVQTEYFTSK